MTEAGWTGNKVTAECIRDTLREQGNVLSPHVVAQCIDDLLKTDSYQQGRVACLGDVKRYVERQIKIGEDFIGGPDPNIQRRVALDEVIEYCDRQLAQAQDEKGVGDGNTKG